jgi:hypothetical protein
MNIQEYSEDSHNNDIKIKKFAYYHLLQVVRLKI